MFLRLRRGPRVENGLRVFGEISVDGVESPRVESGRVGFLPPRSRRSIDRLSVSEIRKRDRRVNPPSCLAFPTSQSWGRTGPGEFETRGPDRTTEDFLLVSGWVGMGWGGSGSRLLHSKGLSRRPLVNDSRRSLPSTECGHSPD